MGRPLKILFLDFSTRLDTVDDLKTRARGGMVSSLFRVPDELSKLGHDVFVLADISKDGQTEAGVIWCAKDGGCWLKGEDWDFLVLNRGIAEGYTGLIAKHRILWTHDLPHNGFITEPKMMNAFLGTVFMSRYAERIWRAFYGTIGRSFLIPNGVDRDIFFPRQKVLTDIIYASAPNRGLKRLGLISDAVKYRIKHASITAYSNMAKLHPNEIKDNDYAADYEKIKDSTVTLKDPVQQDEFAQILGRSGLMVLPSDYPEICSNTVLQALASGVPIVTTGNLGATCEWVRHMKNGYLTDFHVHDYMIHTVEIVRGLTTILENEKLHRKLIKGATNTKIYSWKQIGKLWEAMFKKIM